MSLRLTHEVLHLGLRDPFRIARTDHAARARRDDGRRRAPRRPVPGHRRGGRGLPGPVLRRDAGDDGGRLPAAARRRRRARPVRGGPARGRPGAWTAAIRGHGAARCARRHRAPRPRRQGRRRPVHELLGLSADLPPTDFTIGIDEPDVVAERAARAAHFPALKIKCGGPARPRDARGGPRGLRRPDPGRRQHRLDPGRGGRAAARARAARRRAHRAAVPGRAGSTSSRWLQERSSLPIVADESCVTAPRISTASSASSPGSTSSSPSAAGSGPRRRMLERARELGFRTFLGCMEETSVGIAGVGGRRVAGRLGRPRRLPAAGRRPVRGPRARRRPPLDPGRPDPGSG